MREDPGRPAEGPPLPTNTVLATSRTQGDAGAGGGSCSSLDGNPVWKLKHKSLHWFLPLCSRSDWKGDVTCSGARTTALTERTRPHAPARLGYEPTFHGAGSQARVRSFYLLFIFYF